MELVDKSAVVAEIERRKQVAFGWMETAPNDAIEAEFELCDDILSFLDSLEVKEVNLEKEIDVWYQKPPKEFENIEECAKHFFELGLKAKG